MTDSPLSAGPPPGWYADSPTSIRLRWWTGSAWSDHHQGATEPVSVVDPLETPTDADPPATAEVPMTRAARRAAASVSRSIDVAEPPTAQVPPTRAGLRARTAAHTSVRPETVAEPVEAWSVSAEAPPAPQLEPSPTARPVAPSTTEAFPDQILDRNPPSDNFRPPPRPVTYLPQPSGYVHVPQNTLLPVSSSNGPAKTSIALILLSLLSGLATHFWLSTSRPLLAGVINLAVTALLFAALVLAIIGLFIAVRRPTKKRESIFALVVSNLAIAGGIALLMLRLIPVGAMYTVG